MSFEQECIRDSLPIWEERMNSPFLRQLEDGTRPALLERCGLTVADLHRLPQRPENRTYAQCMLTASQKVGMPECMMRAQPRATSDAHTKALHTACAGPSFAMYRSCSAPVRGSVRGQNGAASSPVTSSPKSPMEMFTPLTSTPSSARMRM